MDHIDECPKCYSHELLISDNAQTIICSECGVIKKEGIEIGIPNNSPQEIEILEAS
ncbi:MULTISPECIES: hypothetical protein [Aliivibrio]|uniref:hypothetical protein n=1 Tax=Aliivibrio TaxID=511678 RepID=UPI0002E79AFA|nr:MULTISPECIES: hypothetical protein [Aliivibrio]MBB1315134.1 hypothetical protein [Aliivibrio sp. SR45-2]